MYFTTEAKKLLADILDVDGLHIVYLTGNLGSGKTSFVKAFMSQIGFDPQDILSPSFLKMYHYQASLGGVVHIDCYRMDSVADIKNLGLVEYEDKLKLIFVEWPKIFSEYIKSSKIDFLSEAKITSLDIDDNHLLNWNM